VAPGRAEGPVRTGNTAEHAAPRGCPRARETLQRRFQSSLQETKIIRTAATLLDDDSRSYLPHGDRLLMALRSATPRTGYMLSLRHPTHHDSRADDTLLAMAAVSPSHICTVLRRTLAMP